MAKLSKQTIAQTFKFNCDRYLRFELSTKLEREVIGISNITLGNMRPGVQLMIDAANKWEADKYQDLIDCADKGDVLYLLEDKIDHRIGRKRFKDVSFFFDVLKLPKPPLAIIEGIFEVPENLSESFNIIKSKYGIELSQVKPDIVWIRKYSTGAPLIKTSDKTPEFELHIIDVKMASEASLKHFTEVTFYALALAEALKKEGLDNRYQVSAKGLIWPGNHDNNKFRNVFREYRAKNDPEPLNSALNFTLDEVPYEIYEIHVKKFLDEKILNVLREEPSKASWHVSSKCQLCQYLSHCQKEAIETDHLSRIAWLNQGQADLLRQNNILTTKSLLDAIESDTPDWQKVKRENYQLKADQLALYARSKALNTNQPEIIQQRKCNFIPNWVDMSIYLTIHFDPGTGLTFALGAKKVYFPPGRNVGDAPIVEERIFIIDKVDSLNPDTERNRLIEFIDLVSGWFMEADTVNNRIRNQRHLAGEPDIDFGKVTAHVFFWNQLEVRQMLRMIERHMTDPRVVDKVELLIRLFPPDGILPTDTEAYKSQPGTVVKDVVKQLVGLPISHDYTLLESANTFYPSLNKDGNYYKYFVSYGFETPLNDQIPFERAYELWKDDVFLKRQKKVDGSNYTDEEKARGINRYTRDDIYEGIKRSIKTHLNAIQHIVICLRSKCIGQLTLKKSGFSAAAPTTARVPQKARQLITFQKLDAITQEIENRHQLSLPVEEKEARFISILGLQPAKGDLFDSEIEKVKGFDPRLITQDLRAFTFSINSKDAKIKDGDFLCAISNEENPVQLDMPWYKHLGLNFGAGRQLMITSGINKESDFNRKISSLLQVTVIKIIATEETPFLILKINNSILFQFAIDSGIIELERPMVLDPFFKDFESDDLEKTLRMIGGRATVR